MPAKTANSKWQIADRAPYAIRSFAHSPIRPFAAYAQNTHGSQLATALRFRLPKWVMNPSENMNASAAVSAATRRTRRPARQQQIHPRAGEPDVRHAEPLEARRMGSRAAAGREASSADRGSQPGYRRHAARRRKGPRSRAARRRRSGSRRQNDRWERGRRRDRRRRPASSSARRQRARRSPMSPGPAAPRRRHRDATACAATAPVCGQHHAPHGHTGDYQQEPTHRRPILSIKTSVCFGNRSHDADHTTKRAARQAAGRSPDIGRLACCLSPASISVMMIALCRVR